MKTISITEIENIRIGNYTDSENGTGVTAIIMPNGGAAGVDVRGGGPASRETTLLCPTANAQIIHSVVLGGGSAYGLDAAGGVMKFLEEKNIGYPVGKGVVPLVVQSDIFDLGCGSFDVRPDSACGYEAAKNAWENNYSDGCVGGGTGATAGKMKGMGFCTKTGIGSHAVQIGEMKIGAVVVVNALGNIYDKSGRCIAGMLNDSRTDYDSIEEMMYANYSKVQENKFVGNTTIGAIITNAKFDKSRLAKIASMAHNGYARAIRPVHTSGDGDTIYAISVGEVAADSDIMGTLAAEVMHQAIINAVANATSCFGIEKSIKI